MDGRVKVGIGCGTVLFIFLIILALSIAGVITAPARVAFWNTHRHNIQTAHDRTDYATLRKVEDTARAMIASIESDRLTWEQFKDSEVQEERNWANSARMRGNRSISTFENFMRENSYIWAYAIPNDLREPIALIGE